MSRKYRKHRSVLRLESIYNVPVRPNNKINNPSFLHRPLPIPLTEEDSLVYVYETDLKGRIIKVINVSYQILINNKLITILRFDSEHGILHGHLRLSLDDQTEVPLAININVEADPHEWLTWAVDYIKDNYLDYRKDFFERNLLDKSVP